MMLMLLLAFADRRFEESMVNGQFMRRDADGWLAGCSDQGRYEHRLFDNIPPLCVRENAIVNRVGAG